LIDRLKEGEYEGRERQVGDNIKMDGAFCELDTSGLVEIQ